MKDRRWRKAGNRDMREKAVSGTQTKTIAQVGLMAALICVMGPFSIPLPISPVPISLTNLAVYFVIYAIGMKKGTLAYLVYLLIGFAGLPVFSAFTGGAGKLLGPTGGYLIGFIFMALICGAFIEKWPERLSMHCLGMAAGTAVCYLFGTVWLSWQAGMGFSVALAAGVLPFIPGDLAKIIVSMLLGSQIRKKLKAFGMV